jgi:predicted ATPase
LLRAALATCERTGWLFCYPEFMGMLAEGLAGLGQHGEALAAIDKALARANATGERWYVPELLRIRGELLHEAGDPASLSEAEQHFRRALDMAEGQGARFWELRAASSLASLQAAQNRRDEAKSVLTAVYNRFTEGFATADLLSAKAQIDSL